MSENIKDRLREFLNKMPLGANQRETAFEQIEKISNEYALAILEDLEGAVMSLKEALEALRSQD